MTLREIVRLERDPKRRRKEEKKGKESKGEEYQWRGDTIDSRT